MAAPITDTQMNEIKEAFSMFDKAGDGCISPEQLVQVLQSMGEAISSKEKDSIMKSLDKDANGTISLDEFINIYERRSELRESVMIADEDLLEAFKVFDQDGDGLISKVELRRVLSSIGQVLTEEQVSKIVEDVDDDNDGNIDFEEFVKLLAIGMGKL